MFFLGISCKVSMFFLGISWNHCTVKAENPNGLTAKGKTEGSGATAGNRTRVSSLEGYDPNR